MKFKASSSDSLKEAPFNADDRVGEEGVSRSYEEDLQRRNPQKDIKITDSLSVESLPTTNQY